MQHAHWIAQAREHWKEHRPAMTARLEAKGTLDKELQAAAEATAAEMRALVEQGATQYEAWEMVRENHLFLAPEDDEMAEPMEDSGGYEAALDLSRGLGSLTMPGERET